MLTIPRDFLSTDGSLKDVGHQDLPIVCERYRHALDSVNVNTFFFSIHLAAYLLRGKHTVNFIAVNWSKASSSLNYAVSRKRVNSIGPYVARLINLLVQNMGAKHDDIHIIGHSLGAHIAGIGEKLSLNINEIQF